LQLLQIELNRAIMAMAGEARALYDRKQVSGLQVSDQDALTAAISTVRDDATGRSWLAVCYATKSKVKLQSTGSGLEALQTLLADKTDKVYYALKGCLDASGKARMLAITWTGEHTPAVKKGRVTLHAGAMESLLPNAAARV